MGTVIDISSHNNITDWVAVRNANVDGAWVKLTQGTNYENPSMRSQIDGARSVSLPAGGYHFGDPRAGAFEQADRFGLWLRQLGLTGDSSLAAMYDAENWPEGGLVWPSPDVLNSHIRHHIHRLRSQHGVRKQIVYASLSWWLDGTLRPNQWLDDDVLLWIAAYNDKPGVTPGFMHRQAALHQFTSSSSLPGNPGRFDRNAFTNGYTIGDLTMSGLDPLKVWEQKITVAAPGDRTHREHREAAEVVGDAMFYASNLWHEDVPELRIKVDKMEAAIGDINRSLQIIAERLVKLAPPSEV